MFIKTLLDNKVPGIHGAYLKIRLLLLCLAWATFCFNWWLRKPVDFAPSPTRSEVHSDPQFFPMAVADQTPSNHAQGRPVIPAYVKAISGSLGGIVEASCLQPIDVIKTRLQLDRTGTYKGIIHCGGTAAKIEGARALWKGLTPFATHLTLKYALRMGSNAVLQSTFKDSNTGKISDGGRFVSGFGAGVIEALAIVTPFEVVKIRLQQQKGTSQNVVKYKGPIHCARLIVREEGVAGLWSGAAPTVMRNGINQAVMFTAKNTFDKLLWRKHEGDGKILQPWESMISGFLAGTVGPVCTGPFDVIKTRLMAQSGEMKYKGMVHAFSTIYGEEGLRALWKGLVPRLMRIPPGQAIMWGVADQVIGFYETNYVHRESSLRRGLAS